MDTDLILAYALAGLTLAVIEGIKPGPLLTMVVRETLSGDLRAGIWTAAAPIFTDGPLIVVSYLFASVLVDNPSILVLISILGALFMFKMGVECFSIEPPTLSSILEPASSKKAFGRGVLTNLLNPNVYVFWFLIGGPIMASAVNIRAASTTSLRCHIHNWHYSGQMPHRNYASQDEGRHATPHLQVHTILVRCCHDYLRTRLLGIRMVSVPIDLKNALSASI
ncbi:MAG: hypothetical protein CM15mP82_4040 [Methanobacteriota archaeon]|nr:MAG: hypothetical protein CM15mP82_4040 [Euryarchaeota archaeon]